jgi:hypothetical protein
MTNMFLEATLYCCLDFFSFSLNGILPPLRGSPPLLLLLRPMGFAAALTAWPPSASSGDATATAWHLRSFGLTPDASPLFLLHNSTSLLLLKSLSVTQNAAAAALAAAAAADPPLSVRLWHLSE